MCDNSNLTIPSPLIRQAVAIALERNALERNTKAALNNDDNKATLNNDNTKAALNNDNAKAALNNDERKKAGTAPIKKLFYTKKKKAPSNNDNATSALNNDSDESSILLVEPTSQPKRKKAGTTPSKKLQPTNKKKAKKTLVTKVDQSKQRQPNFNASEDIVLCKAYVYCTENPLIGNDQTAEIFWNSVLEAYNNINSTNAIDDEAIAERDSVSLRNRFQRTIAKQVKEWNPFYKRIAEAPPSGTVRDDWIRMASNDYFEQYQRKFVLEHCVDILHEIPKFDPMVMDATDHEEGILEENGEPAAVNNTTIAMASKLERPIGNKKARQNEKDDRSIASIMSQQQSNLDTLAVSNNNIANALKQKNRIKSKQMKLNNLWKRLGYYENKGNEMKVDELMQQIEAVEQEEENEEESSSNNSAIV